MNDNMPDETHFPMGQQLPLWPNKWRGLPSATLRSALFAPVKRGQRAALQREVISSISQYRIVYTGVTLDTADLEVYEEILHLSRKALGKVVTFNTRKFLQSIERSSGKSNREWLFKSLSRLSGCELEIEKDGKSYAGSFIQEQGRDNKQGMHYIILNPSLAVLFDQGYSIRDPEKLHAMGTSQLAKWLYGFTVGQTRPLTFWTDDLALYTRSQTHRQRDFRRRLDAAAERVAAAGHPIKLDWHDNGKKVTIGREPKRDSYAPPGV